MHLLLSANKWTRSKDEGGGRGVFLLVYFWKKGNKRPPEEHYKKHKEINYIFALNIAVFFVLFIMLFRSTEAF